MHSSRKHKKTHKRRHISKMRRRRVTAMKRRSVTTMKKRSVTAMKRRRHVVVPVFSKNPDKLSDELDKSDERDKSKTDAKSSGNIIDGMRDFIIKKKGFVM